MRSGIYAKANAEKRKVQSANQKVLNIGGRNFSVVEEPQHSPTEVETTSASTCYVVQNGKGDSYQIYNQSNGKLSSGFSCVKRLDTDLFYVRLNDKDKTELIYLDDEFYDLEDVKRNPGIEIGDVEGLIDNSKYETHTIGKAQSQMGE